MKNVFGNPANNRAGFGAARAQQMAQELGNLERGNLFGRAGLNRSTGSGNLGQVQPGKRPGETGSLPGLEKILKFFDLLTLVLLIQFPNGSIFFLRRRKSFKRLLSLLFCGEKFYMSQIP